MILYFKIRNESMQTKYCIWKFLEVYLVFLPRLHGVPNSLITLKEFISLDMKKIGTFVQ